MLSVYDAGDGTRPHMCSDTRVLFCCVSTLFIIPMMYACDVPSVREALGRQKIAEVLGGRELEQDFERWAGLFVHCKGRTRIGPASSSDARQTIHLEYIINGSSLLKLLDFVLL